MLADPSAVSAVAEVEAELELLERAGYSAQAVAELQSRKLERLWRRAAATPYYAAVLTSAKPALDGVPPTPKAIVRRQWKRFLTPEGSHPARYYETSGTTKGGPVPVPRLAEDMVWNTVTLAGAWARLLPPGEPVAVLLPSDVVPVGDTVTAACEYLGAPVVRCYPYAVGLCDFDRVQEIVRRLRPRTIFAAPGLLMELMRALKRRGSFADVAASVSRIMLLGEVSTASLQQLIAREWNAAVLDASYGSTETGTIAAACPSNRLHLLVSAFIAEIERDGTVGPAAPGDAGGLVVTALNAYARPLLRYETGDTVTVSGECPCGLPVPTVAVGGRTGETVTVGDAVLDIASVEERVYALEGVTGYLLELDDGSVSLVIERDVDCESSDEELTSSAVEAFAEAGVPLASVRPVHQLPTTTKSGAAQKNWKRTNVRLVG